jgi:phosphate transport system substrate-binding protein
MLLSRQLMTRRAAAFTGALWMFAGAMLGPALAEGIELRGAGSTFAAPLYEKWIEAFRRLHPEIAVRYEAVGSGEGIARFRAAAVDFAGSDVPLPASAATKIERGAVQMPSTAGMIVLAYNLPGLAGQLKLPQDVYVDIFLGKILAWNDPRIRAANPGLALPSRNIALIGRQDSSGTTFAFTTHLAAVAARWSDEGPGVGKLVAWPKGAMIARGNEGVAARIKISEGAIGYVEFGFARRIGLPVALLQNKAGAFVAPSQESGTAALAASAGYGLEGLAASMTNPAGPQTYPIVTYSWLLLYANYPAERAQAMTSFANWGLTSGQSFAADLGYLALPQAVADLGKGALSQIK